MKLGIVIPVYNRPQYLKQCIDSLQSARIPEGVLIIFIDDRSTDKEVSLLLRANMESLNATVITNAKNEGVCYSLKKGIDQCLLNGCDLIINLDSDAIVRPDFIEKILAIKERFPDKIVTGFNCLTRNANGTERHPVIEQGDGWNIKKSVGGINMCFDRKQYESWILPALEKGIKRLCNWDAEACKNSGGAVCVVPSVVQHIGTHSSMGHHEAPDVADDFVIEPNYPEIGVIKNDSERLCLPSVTLITVNCDKIESGIAAMEASIKDIDFAEVKFLTSVDTDYKYAVKIPHIGTIQEYSRFMVKELTKYVQTDFVLVIQSDGYVKNPAGWLPEFLNYDYIGATWWYNDRHNVGNGGFSLRSKRLLDVLATDRSILKTHPEDDVICRRYGRYLQRRHGINFAPDKVAKKFSIEGFRQKDKTYSGQFGFHGHGVIFPGQEPVSKVVKSDHVKESAQIVVINQPFGLGDFLFCIPIARDFIKQGYKVIWPVIPAYQNINRHFPDITFVNKDMLNIDYERKDEYEVNGMRVIPLRWSYEILRLPFRDCMKSKYMLFKQDWRRWRECTWSRDTTNEDYLYYNVLGLTDDSKYNLINATFRNDRSGRVGVAVNNGFENIELRSIEGFTLLDWCKVIERAQTIHTVSTSINYLIELLNLKASEVHLYVRKPDERDFRNISYLFTKRYRLHL